jgi:hypothetical protein
MKKLIFVLCVWLVLFYCTYKEELPSVHGPAGSSKIMGDNGEIGTHSEHPTYGSYYANLDDSLTADVWVKNVDAASHAYTVDFIIIERNSETEYLLDSQTTSTITAGDSELVSFKEPLPSSFISGWYKSKLLVKLNSTEEDSDTKDWAFSGFRRSESFSSLSGYTTSNSPVTYDECSTYTNYYGYLSSNSNIVGSDLELKIPSNQSTTRKGGEVSYNTSYLYGMFKATIHMDLDSTHHLGAFWLSASPWRDAIVMEVFNHPNGYYQIDCNVWEDSTMTSHKPYVVSGVDMTDTLEYIIEWSSEFVRFYFNGSCIDTSGSGAKIPEGALKPFFSYRIVPWPNTVCEPNLATTDSKYTCFWAAY